MVHWKRNNKYTKCEHLNRTQKRQCNSRNSYVVTERASTSTLEFASFRFAL